MYITGTTNMLPSVGGNGEAFSPFQCATVLPQRSEQPRNLHRANGTTNTDAFVAKINPNQAGFKSVYSTYVGGDGSDIGLAIDVDTSGMAYITGSTNSLVWVSLAPAFRALTGGALTPSSSRSATSSDRYIRSITSPIWAAPATTSAMTSKWTRSGPSTSSVQPPPPNFFPNPLQPTPGGTRHARWRQEDAFVASIGTTLSGVAPVII